MADIYNAELPEHIEKPLRELVGIAKKYKLLTLMFTRPNFKRGCVIMVPEGGSETIESPEEDFLLGLKALGFLQITDHEGQTGRNSGGHIFLTEKAYDWVRHREKGKWSRGLDIAIYNGKQAAPLIVSIAAVILTLLQILQTWNDLFSP